MRIRPLYLSSALFMSQCAAAFAQSPFVELDQTASTWLEAVRTDRADMLLLGDSVVLFGGHGWDDGLNRAGAERFGLAGSGLLHNTASGDGFRLLPQFGWLTSPNAVPEDARRYIVQNIAHTSGTGSQRRLGISVDASSPLAFQPLVLQGWGVSASGSDAMTAAARLSFSPFSVLYRSPSLSLGFPSTGLDKVSQHINGPLTGSPTSLDYYFDNSVDSSFMYLRMLRPGANGLTVTSIGVGGQSTRSFYNGMWNGGSWDQIGRAAYLDTIVDGGSGKLLVPIFEGFNDRNEMQPSLGEQITPGNSPEAFADNVDALIQLIRSDWALTGRSQKDLGFIVFSMYDINPPDSAEQLIEFGDALRAYAASESGVSFIDLRAIGIPYTVGAAQGFFSDGLHLSRAGTQYYSRRIFDALLSADCPGDIADDFGQQASDGEVGFGDFLALLGLIGPCPLGTVVCVGDIADDLGNTYPDGGPDGTVSFGDFLALLGRIGPCD